MFQQQFGSIASALKAAGLPHDSATAIARILANPQNTHRSSPITTDSTPRNMRLVTRDDRKYTLPNLDFRDGDPDYRASRVPTSEEQPEPEQPPTVHVDVAPQQAANVAFNVAPGGFANAVPRGNAVEVGMRVRGPDRSVATLDTNSSSIVGKRIRAEAAPLTGLRFFIEDTGQELVWKLLPEDRARNLADPPACETSVDVVTDIRLEASGFVIEKQRLLVCGTAPPPPASEIPTDTHTVVTDVRLESSGLVIDKKTIVVCDTIDPATSSTIPTDECAQQ